MIKEILTKFKNKKFKIGIIGLGYVGLPLCQRFTKAGVNVIGVDNDSFKIEALKKGVPYIKSNKLKNYKYFKNNKENLSTNYNILKKCDAILISDTGIIANNTPFLMKLTLILVNHSIFLSCDFDCFVKKMHT